MRVLLSVLGVLALIGLAPMTAVAADESVNLRLIAEGGDTSGEALGTIKRLVHSVKGMGGTFGFSSVTVISHAIEDYIEAAAAIGAAQTRDIQKYLDQIWTILETGIDLDDEQVTAVVHGVALEAFGDSNGAAAAETPRAGARVLCIMPQDVQRKMVVGQLTDLGLSVTSTDNVIEAIDLGITHRPEVIISSLILDRLDGIQLANVFANLEATAASQFVLIPSTRIPPEKIDRMPATSTVIVKGMSFLDDLIAHLENLGVVADF